VPVVRLVNSILLDAIRRGASDIHLDPSENALRIRFRVDGVLHEVMTPPKRVEPAVVSRLKIMASLDIAERRLPQDGRIKLRQARREIDFRVSVLPTIFGESISLRILDRDALKVNLVQLGFEPTALAEFQKAIQHPHGMILLTGPTGAGKTTTLYSALHAINRGDRNIVTVEDPVEYELRGVTQVQVNDEIGRTFASALRSFLRHDPDVILVGEMRDQETAQIAVRAALTGHLVLSTVHTNDAASTLARLSDMGVPPFLVASALKLVVAQRLVRRVCQDCREPYEVDEEALIPHGHAPLGLGRVTLYRGKGCATCHYTGMKGRSAIYEVLPVTPEIRGLILHSTFADEIHDVAQKQGMKTLREAGLARVLEGATTVEEVLRVTTD
jgi:type IV pilus assembly protein PilB